LSPNFTAGGTYFLPLYLNELRRNPTSEIDLVLAKLTALMRHRFDPHVGWVKMAQPFMYDEDETTTRIHYVSVTVLALLYVDRLLARRAYSYIHNI
jgi:hypothetical protein